MTDPSAAAWRRVFLRELARSGNVAGAAALAGIDRSSAYQLRRRNSAFAASWDRAQEAARAACEPDRVLRPARAAPRLSARETVRASCAGRPCIVRVGPGRWSRASEAAFLATLCATANVRAAAAAAGVSAVAAYARRRKWPAFAAAWDEAKAEGYARIELLLLHAATVTLDPPAVPIVPEPPAMTCDQAMNLLKLHRASQHGGAPKRYAWRAQEPDIEDVRAEVLRKVAALERARGG
jgi:hypothetical protein